MFIYFNVLWTSKTSSQINVSGEGKVKVIPDQATITVTVGNQGNNAKDVKKTK
jgi:uncharacterized protein YggE